MERHAILAAKVDARLIVCSGSKDVGTHDMWIEGNMPGRESKE
jgi:hypothetical protein